MSSSSERMVAIEWSMRSLIGTSVPPSQAQANLPSQPLLVVVYLLITRITSR